MTKPTHLLLRDKILIFFSGSLMSFVVVAFCVLSMNYGYHVIIFSLITILVSVFYLHKHFYNRILNVQKDLELYYQNECKKAQTIQRHSLRNQLQVLSGYIETEQFDKALDCIADLAKGADSIPLHEQFDTLQVLIHQYMHKAYRAGFKLSYDLEDLALNPLSSAGHMQASICKALSLVFEQVWAYLETELRPEHEIHLTINLLSNELMAKAKLHVTLSLVSRGLIKAPGTRTNITKNGQDILSRLGLQIQQTQQPFIDHYLDLNTGIIVFIVEL